MSYYLLSTNCLENLTDEKTWNAMSSQAFSAGSKDNAIASKSKVERGLFRSGSLDSLMGLLEIIAKVDSNVEMILKKIQKQIIDLDPQWEMKIETNNGKIPVDKYLREFVWEESKFPRSKTLTELMGIANEKAANADKELKKLSNEYGDTKNSLNTLQRKQEGNFLSKDLFEDIFNKQIPKEIFVYESKLLETLIAVVPKTQIKAWENGYFKINEKWVVPKSTRNLEIQDKDGNQLWIFTMFKQEVPSYCVKAKSELKVTVRPFNYDESQYQNDKKARISLEETLKIQRTKLLKNSEILFNSVYEAMLHLKYIRIHIDSVLRWGLPPKYISGIVKPLPGKEKPLLTTLKNIFAPKGQAEMYGSKDDLGESEDYYPFVWVKINIP